MVGTTNRSIAAIPSAWLRRNVLHPCEGGTLLRTIYLATLVWPTSMPSLRSSPWILGAPHNGLAPLIWQISWRISTVTAGRPQRCFDFHRQYDLNPPRCQRITVSGRTIASAPYILGNSRQTPPNINLSIETNRSLLGLARRSTLICCLSTRISASSATRDRNRSLAIAKINRHKSSIGYQHRAILSQLPARLNLRQGQLFRHHDGQGDGRQANLEQCFNRYAMDFHCASQHSTSRPVPRSPARKKTIATVYGTGRHWDEVREGLTMSKILSGTELEVIVSKLMAAEAEILHLAIEDENVSEAASDLWGVFEMLQEIILKIQSLL